MKQEISIERIKTVRKQRETLFGPVYIKKEEGKFYIVDKVPEEEDVPCVCMRCDKVLKDCSKVFDRLNKRIEKYPYISSAYEVISPDFSDCRIIVRECKCFKADSRRQEKLDGKGKKKIREFGMLYFGCNSVQELEKMLKKNLEESTNF